MFSCLLSPNLIASARAIDAYVGFDSPMFESRTLIPHIGSSSNLNPFVQALQAAGGPMLPSAFSPVVPKRSPVKIVGPRTTAIPAKNPVNNPTINPAKSPAKSPPKRRLVPNPVCLDSTHFIQKNRTSIQKHTCRHCFQKRFKELLAKPWLSHWRVTRMLVREFRNYRCSCCILQACKTGEVNMKKIGLGKRCRKGPGHLPYSQMRVCARHGTRLTCCFACVNEDPRAGTSFTICGERYMGGSICKLNKCQCLDKYENAPTTQEKMAEEKELGENLISRVFRMHGQGSLTALATVAYVAAMVDPATAAGVEAAAGGVGGVGASDSPDPHETEDDEEDEMVIDEGLEDELGDGTGYGMGNGVDDGLGDV